MAGADFGLSRPSTNKAHFKSFSPLPSIVSSMLQMDGAESTMCIISSKEVIITKSKRTKSVSFPVIHHDCSFSDIRFITSRLDMTADDIERQWFGPDDFRTFKVTAWQIARQARISGFNDLLKDSFESRLVSSTEDPLMKWSRYCHSRRGLEEMVSPKHGNERSRRKKLAIRAVLHEQIRLRAIGAEQDEISSHLATVSAQHTQAAALFAHRMGNADADVALFEIRPDPPSPDVRRRSRSNTLEYFKNDADADALRAVIIALGHRSLPTENMSACNTAA